MITFISILIALWLIFRLFLLYKSRKQLLLVDAVIAEYIGSMFKVVSEYELSKADNFGQSLQRDEHSQIGGYSGMNGSVGPTQPQSLSTLEASKTGKNSAKVGSKTAKAVKNAAGKPPKRGKPGR
jgi:hypothetical protein